MLVGHGHAAVSIEQRPAVDGNRPSEVAPA